MHTRHENSIYRVSVRAIHGVMSPPDFGGFSVSGQPSAGREFGDPIDRKVSQSRQDRAKIVADWHLESSAGFDDLRLWLQRANSRYGITCSLRQGYTYLQQIPDSAPA